MDKKMLYLDSNVFIAFIKSEIGKPFKLMFKEVEDFLAACPEKYVLVLSHHTLNEIEKIVRYSKEETIDFFKNLEIQINSVETKKEDIEKMKEFIRKGMHSTDALHATLAIRTKCNAIITFNKKDFETVKKIIEVKEPLELV